MSDPQALAQAYADHAALEAADGDWPAAAENYQAAADVCRTEDRKLRQAALQPTQWYRPEDVARSELDREPVTCTCLDPDPEPIGSCGRCHRLIEGSAR